MKICKDFISRLYSDADAITSENIAYDESHSISEELKSSISDNVTMTNGVIVTLSGDSSCNGLYVYSGILSGKPYYKYNNYRLIWSASNYRWELQSISPNVIYYYNDTLINLSKPYYDLNWHVGTGGTSPVPNFSNSDKTLKIKNINYIIDDDNQSIDGSNTSMVDSHTEIPTRAYVDLNIQNNLFWKQIGTQLTPFDSTADNILINVDHNGCNFISLENTNVGNSASVVFEAHKTNTTFQDNIYMGMYSDNFWIPAIAGKGVLFTDQDLVIGTVDDTKNINFLIGNSYTSPIVVGHLNKNGLYLDTLKSTSVHPTSYYNLFVDENTGLIYASSTGTIGNNPQTDKVIVDSTMVTNKTFVLSQTFDNNHQIYIYQNGLLLEDGYEWTISGNVITFTEAETPLVIGDRIVVKYYY